MRLVVFSRKGESFKSISSVRMTMMFGGAEIISLGINALQADRLEFNIAKSAKIPPSRVFIVCDIK